MNPSKKQLASGVYRLIDGTWHKRCTGIVHKEGVFLPATEKYFYVRKSGAEKGTFIAACRLCENVRQIPSLKTSPFDDRGFVPVSEVLHFYIESSNRVGLNEAAIRAEMSQRQYAQIVRGRTKYVRKGKLKKVILELISMRRKNEHSISNRAKVHMVKRSSGLKKTCSGCGGSLNQTTDGCGTCWERDRKKRQRAEVQAA